MTRGNIAKDDLVARVRDGLLVKGLMGYGQGNLINGDFSCNLSLGYRIRDGEIAGRVKDTMVSGNVYELLRQNVVLSRDSDYLGQYPWVMVEGLTVSTKA
jgi:PmbA protein